MDDEYSVAVSGLVVCLCLCICQYRKGLSWGGGGGVSSSLPYTRKLPQQPTLHGRLCGHQSPGKWGEQLIRRFVRSFVFVLWVFCVSRDMQSRRKTICKGSPSSFISSSSMCSVLCFVWVCVCVCVSRCFAACADVIETPASTLMPNETKRSHWIYIMVEEQGDLGQSNTYILYFHVWRIQRQVDWVNSDFACNTRTWG